MIVQRVSYISNLRANEKIDLFHSLLFGSKSNEAEGGNFEKLINSIQNSDQDSFKEIHAQFAAREPSIDSPFINDNYLLFLLIFGAKKFECNLTWISKVLELRSTTNDDSKQISKTFKNIIADNFTSKSNDFGIIMTYEYLIDKKIITWQERQYFYQELVKRPFPFYSDDLLNLMSLKAYDIVILEGDEQRESKYNTLLDFESKFIKLVSSYSIVLQVFVNVVLIGAVIYLRNTFPWFKAQLKDNLIYLALFGGGAIIGQFLTKSRLRNIFKVILYKIWGYQ